jgi:mycothiol synthase
VLVVPGGLSVRPATMADAGAVTDLVVACEVADDGETVTDEADVPSEWSRPTFDPSRDARLVFDGERLVAYAEVHGARRAWGFVRPEYRGRGIGTALVEWTEGHARLRGGTSVGQSLSENETAGRALLTGRGYEPRWTSWVLEIDVVPPPPPAELPEGVEIRTFHSGSDDGAVYRVIEDAFGEWRDRQPTSFEDWAALTIGRSDFDPSRLWVAVEANEIVGAALGFGSGDEAWIQQLAVERSHRGRGLGRALLRHAFRAFGDRGVRRVVLSTDSRTGALGLYEHVGMRVRRTYTQLARAL